MLFSQCQPSQRTTARIDGANIYNFINKKKINLQKQENLREKASAKSGKTTSVQSPPALRPTAWSPIWGWGWCIDCSSTKLQPAQSFGKVLRYGECVPVWSCTFSAWPTRWYCDCRNRLAYLLPSVSSVPRHVRWPKTHRYCWCHAQGRSERRLAPYGDRLRDIPSGRDCRYGTDFYGRGLYGFYWSATLYEYYSYRAYYLGFRDGGHNWDYNSRCGGLTVRPVTE